MYELLSLLAHVLQCPSHWCTCFCRYCFPIVAGSMSLYHYFKAWDALPHPKGSLLQSVSSATIASANRVELQRVVGNLPTDSHELVCVRSSGRWAAVEVLTARNLFPGRPLGA